MIIVIAAFSVSATRHCDRKVFEATLADTLFGCADYDANEWGKPTANKIERLPKLSV